jgi:hypothetical protein
MTTKSELNTGTICKALAYAIVVIGRIVLLPLTRSWLGKKDHGRSARAGTAGEDVLLITGYRQLTGERQRCFVDAVNWSPAAFPQHGVRPRVPQRRGHRRRRRQILPHHRPRRRRPQPLPPGRLRGGRRKHPRPPRQHRPRAQDHHDRQPGGYRPARAAPRSRDVSVRGPRPSGLIPVGRPIPGSSPAHPPTAVRTRC